MAAGIPSGNGYGYGTGSGYGYDPNGYGGYGGGYQNFPGNGPIYVPDISLPQPPEPTDFDSLRNILQAAPNSDGGDKHLSIQELKDLRNQQLLNGNTKTAETVDALIEHYGELSDGGVFGLIKGVSEDKLYDLLDRTSRGESLDAAIDEVGR